jgi:hypothetical protein
MNGIGEVLKYILWRAFDAREAKRLFGFIGPGAIAGSIFGGYLTSLLAPYIGSENLLFVCAALPIPLGIKKQTKTFIDVFVDSAATGFGGLILIFWSAASTCPPALSAS